MIIAKTNSKLFLPASQYSSDIDNSQIIARYYSPGLVKLLVSQHAIYFHPIDKYRTDYEQGKGGDPNENRAPEAQYAGSWPRDNPRQREKHERIHAYKKQQIKVYASCWTKFDGEDAKMWAKFGKAPGSICLITSVGKVLSSLSNANVYARTIEYIPDDSYEPYAHEPNRRRIEGPLFSFPDLEMGDIVLDSFFKTCNYKWEKEVRFVVFSKEDINLEKRLLKINDMTSLGDRIILSPYYAEEAAVCKSELSEVFDVPIEDSKYSAEIFGDTAR